MIISVTSPRRGVGRTLFSIILGLRLAERDERISLVDLNRSQDLEYYLNKSDLSRNLDDFCQAMDARYFSNDINVFARKCMKQVRSNVFLTGAPEHYVMNKEYFYEFLRLSQDSFSHSIFDCASGYDDESELIYDMSDFIIVNVTQDIRTTDMIKHQYSDLYKKYGNKVVFVINQYLEGIGRTPMNVREKEIRSQLLQAGLEARTFVVPFSPPLINEANANNLLLFNDKKLDSGYLGRVDVLADFLLGV